MIWGSTYLGIRVAVETIPPMVMAGVRFLPAGLIVYAVAIRGGDRAGDRPTLRQWRSAAIAGGLLVVAGNALIGEAEKVIASGVAALIVATVPLWFVAIDRIVSGARIRPLALVGMLVALGGAVLLVRPSGPSHIDLRGVAVVVVASACWASGSLFMRDADLPRRVFVASGMEMICGGALALLVALPLGEWARPNPAAVSTRSLVALVYLLLAGSLLAFTAYQHALRTLPTPTVSTYAFVNPVIAVVLGALVLGEQVDIRTAMAAAVMVTGVAMVITHPSRRPRDLRPAAAEGAA